MSDTVYQSRKVTEDDVIACYRAILQREPESKLVVDSVVRQSGSLEVVVRQFLQSDEYRNRHNLICDYRANRLDIECHVDPEVRSLLFERTSQQWKKLGETEPHWSVLTSDLFKSHSIVANKDRFNSTGKHDADLVDLFFSRSGYHLPLDLDCIELGCGVGRVTRFLAEKFRRVIGLDISPGNLRCASEYLQSQEVGNVDLVLVQKMEEFSALPEYDFFYSVIVLQHNPPPVQLFVLDVLLSKLRPGGGCLFQIPTELPRYSFHADEYLNNTEQAVMDMHCVPMNEVILILQKHGLCIREVRPDGWTGLPGSFTFFAHPKL
jgi:SAM-dependent methyltransferase